MTRLVKSISLLLPLMLAMAIMTGCVSKSPQPGIICIKNESGREICSLGEPVICKDETHTISIYSRTPETISCQEELERYHKEYLHELNNNSVPKFTNI